MTINEHLTEFAGRPVEDWHPDSGLPDPEGTIYRISLSYEDGEEGRDGTVRRCHFVRTPIGNIYEPEFEQALRERPRPRAACSCHIGYVHMDDLGLYEVFGEGALERIPT